MLKPEALQKESKFVTFYKKWKEQVRDARIRRRNECSDEDLGNMMDAVEGLETQVKDAYENIQSQLAHSTDVRRKIESCTAVARDLMELMKVCMSEVGQEEFDANAESAGLC